MAMFDNPGILESKSPRRRLPQPTSRPLRPSLRLQTHRTDPGWPFQATKSSPQFKAAIDKKELPPLEPGTVSYMMSKGSYLTDKGGHNGPHLMFYEAVEGRYCLGRKSRKLPSPSP